MSEQYPFPCVHCGICCMATACPVAVDLVGAEKGKPCPKLEWTEEGKSRCGLARVLPLLVEAIGSGTGCDMLGRAVNTRTGFMQDFASLPDEVKMELGRRLRSQQITLQTAGEVL